MCLLCSQLWIEVHWSDAVSAPTDERSGIVALEKHATQRGERLRDRAVRARLFNLVLASWGLSLQDWEGSSFILRGATGRSAVVSDLAQVWQEIERMTGRPLDLLEPDLLQAIQDRASRLTESG